MGFSIGGGGLPPFLSQLRFLLNAPSFFGEYVKNWNELTKLRQKKRSNSTTPTQRIIMIRRIFHFFLSPPPHQFQKRCYVLARSPCFKHSVSFQAKINNAMLTVQFLKWKIIQIAKYLKSFVNDVNQIKSDLNNSTCKYYHNVYIYQTAD